MNLNKYFFELFENMKKHYLIISLCFISAFIKLCFSNVISTNGDPMMYWEAARSLFSGEGYVEFTHWSSRFGLIIPLFISQRLFGSGIVSYFIPGIVFGVVQTVFLYKISEKILNRYFAFYTVLFFTLQPLMFLHPYGYGVHLYPSVYSITYLLVMYYCLQKYLDNRADKKFLLISSVFMFLAYLSKIENVFFFMPLLFIMRKYIIDYIIFGLVFTFLFTGETILFHLFTDFQLGRLSVLLHSHLRPNNPSLIHVKNIFGLFQRLYIIKPTHIYSFFMFYFLSLFLFIRRQKKITDISIFVWGFLLLMVFAVRKINPLEVALPYNTRYLNVVLPFMSVVIVYGIIYIISLFKKKNVDEILNSYPQKDRVIKMVFILIISVSVFLCLLNFRNNNFFKLYHYKRIVKKAVENEIPFILYEGLESRKGGCVVRDVFIDLERNWEMEFLKTTLKNHDYYYLNYSDKQTENMKLLDDDSRVLIIRSNPVMVEIGSFGQLK